MMLLLAVFWDRLWGSCVLSRGCVQQLVSADALQIVRLAMLSLLAVFRDILPGYRIRLPTEKELAMPVSKDVKRTRDYEASLLRLYQVPAHWYWPQVIDATVQRILA